MKIIQLDADIWAAMTQNGFGAVPKQGYLIPGEMGGKSIWMAVDNSTGHAKKQGFPSFKEAMAWLNEAGLKRESEMSLFELIAEWAEARNLIEGSDSFRQLVKLQEEVGELAAGIAKQRVGEVSDAIGDCVVVLTILALQNGLFIEDCIHRAYQVIKDRKGRMVDGVFVKEGD